MVLLCLLCLKDALRSRAVGVLGWQPGPCGGTGWQQQSSPPPPVRHHRWSCLPGPALDCKSDSAHRPGLAVSLLSSRTLLAQEQARIRQQYEERLRDLESERQSVQEDKAQVGDSGGAGSKGIV